MILSYHIVIRTTIFATILKIIAAHEYYYTSYWEFNIIIYSNTCNFLWFFMYMYVVPIKYKIGREKLRGKED
jgi:hypothetical protein